MTGDFPAQMASNAEDFPFDDVIMRSALGSVVTGVLLVYSPGHFATKPELIYLPI